MYPFGGLPENLAAFCAFLRREHRFAVGSGELQDGARALDIVDVADERVVRDALRPVLCRTPDDVRAFDEAFTAFFFPGPSGIAQPEMPPSSREHDKTHEIDQPRPVRPARAGMGEEHEDPFDRAGQPVISTAPIDSQSVAAMTLARASYSPFAAEQPSEPPQLERVEAAWREAARSLVRRLQLGLARRWRPSARGRRFDLRRTLRTSLQTGGETLIVRWLRRPKRAPRFIVLVDGSRSMGAAASAALHVAVAIAAATTRVEAFTFSTELERITDEVRAAAAGEARRLVHLHYGWGGGTAIGACLRDFLRRFGDRLLARETLVMIASDGLDVGDIGLLRDAMREIRRRSAGVVWMNPLLETAGYEPTARGMAAARPYITTFTTVGNAADFARLAHVIRVRR